MMQSRPGDMPQFGVPVTRADDQYWSMNFVTDNLFSGRLRIAALVFIKQNREENREVMMKNKIVKILTAFFYFNFVVPVCSIY